MSRELPWVSMSIWQKHCFYLDRTRALISITGTLTMFGLGSVINSLHVSAFIVDTIQGIVKNAFVALKKVRSLLQSIRAVR